MRSLYRLVAALCVGGGCVFLCERFGLVPAAVLWAAGFALAANPAAGVRLRRPAWLRWPRPLPWALDEVPVRADDRG